MRTPQPPDAAPAAPPPKPRITTSEPALLGAEFQPIYANFIREPSSLPPPQQGGDEGWPP